MCLSNAVRGHAGWEPTTPMPRPRACREPGDPSRVQFIQHRANYEGSVTRASTYLDPWAGAGSSARAPARVLNIP